jgi:predicted aspartyl protease
MDDQPFAVSLLLNKQCYALALIDSGCSSYGLINSRFASQQSFERIPIAPRPISGFSASVRSQITEVAKVEVDIDGYREEAFFYIIPDLSYDVILGLP